MRTNAALNGYMLCVDNAPTDFTRQRIIIQQQSISISIVTCTSLAISLLRHCTRSSSQEIMRTDLLSKRLFQAGCFGLPWLWIVHILYWRGNTSEANAEALLNPDDHFQQDEPVERDTEAIKEEAEKWVSRCKTGASVVMSCWIGWIIAVQLLRGLLPSSFFMLTADDSASTGW